jgi:NDP-sugar pyrophosphorylase family protein
MSVNNYIGIILSAGIGSRLGGKYRQIPKVIIPIYKKKNSLDYNINILKNFGIKNIFINANIHYDIINSYIKIKYNNDKNIKVIFEKKLLGTAQSVLNMSKIVKNFDKIIVLYGDNISKINLKHTFKNFKFKKSDFYIVSNYINDSGSSGVIKTNKNNYLISFEEKNIKYKTKPNWVNSGIYIISKKILKFIGKKKDFGHDLIPFLLKKKIVIKVFKTKSKIFTIDNEQLLKKTRSEVKF